MGTGLPFNDGSKLDAREKVIAAKEDLATLIQIIDTCFQNVDYILHTPFGTWPEAIDHPLSQANYQ